MYEEDVNDEITSEEEEALEDETTGPGQEPGEPEEDPFKLDPKFKGETEAESLRKAQEAYHNAEKRLGEMGNELGYLRQSSEETRRKLEEIETRSRSNEPSFREKAQELWEEDPATAFVKAVEYFDEKSKNLPLEVETKNRRSQGDALYQNFKESDEDFQTLEPKVREIMNGYQHIIAPEFRGSPEVVALAYAAVKGTNLDHFVAKDRKQRVRVKDEKRANFSESSGANAGGTNRELSWDASDEEIEAAIASEKRSQGQG